MKSWVKLAAGAAAITLATAGCAGSGGTAEQPSSQANQPAQITGDVTVWLMDGSAPDTLTSALNKEFEDKHPGVHVKYEIQKWNGIQQKLTTALASQAPPDVLEIGNTQTPSSPPRGAGGPHQLRGRLQRLAVAEGPQGLRHVRRQAVRCAVLRRQP
ncbi:hypothetical protein GCM10029964_096140 [Kibdelosporangium lantanae]